MTPLQKLNKSDIEIHGSRASASQQVADGIRSSLVRPPTTTTTTTWVSGSVFVSYNAATFSDSWSVSQSYPSCDRKMKTCGEKNIESTFCRTTITSSSSQLQGEGSGTTRGFIGIIIISKFSAGDPLTQVVRPWSSLKLPTQGFRCTPAPLYAGTRLALATRRLHSECRPLTATGCIGGGAGVKGGN